MPGQAVQCLKPGTTQSKAYTGTHGVIDNAVGSETRIVRIVCTTDAFIAFGTSPEATSASMPVMANLLEYFEIDPTHKVSAIQSSAGGTLYVTEMS